MISKKFSSTIISLVCLISLVTCSFASGCSSNSDAVLTTNITKSETLAEPTTIEVTTEESTTEQPTTQKPTKKATEKPTEEPTEKATEPPREIEVTNLTSAVSPGEYASIAIKGEPNTSYSITVRYSSGASTAEGLHSKTSDSSGYVSWEWKVGTRTKSGTYPIKISGGGKTYSTEFTVY